MSASTILIKITDAVWGTKKFVILSIIKTFRLSCLKGVVCARMWKKTC